MSYTLIGALCACEQQLKNSSKQDRCLLSMVSLLSLNCTVWPQAVEKFLKRWKVRQHLANALLEASLDILKLPRNTVNEKLGTERKGGGFTQMLLYLVLV